MVAGLECDLLIKGGRVIDHKNAIDGEMDVAVTDGRIMAVGADLPVERADEVRDASGLIVAPGLIDLHTHVYEKATSYGVAAQPIAQRSVVATMVEAGSAGAGNYAGLRDFVMPAVDIRILAFLNISFPGIFAFDEKVSFGEASVAELLNVDRCVEVIEANRETIVGVKVRLGDAVSDQIGSLALSRALEAAEAVGLPLMTHIGRPPPSYAEILERLRPGDILTHCFRPAPNGPVDETGDVLPELLDARRRGVLFDIGHGKGAFGFASADAAIAQGFLPDIISSDLHRLCVDGPAFDLMHTMSKLINCGVPLGQAIAMVTSAPAAAMGRPDLGQLGVGSPADISLLKLEETEIELVDVEGIGRTGDSRFSAHGLFVAGREIPILDRPFEH